MVEALSVIISDVAGFVFIIANRIFFDYKALSIYVYLPLGLAEARAKSPNKINFIVVLQQVNS